MDTSGIRRPVWRPALGLIWDIPGAPEPSLDPEVDIDVHVTGTGELACDLTVCNGSDTLEPPPSVAKDVKGVTSNDGLIHARAGGEITSGVYWLTEVLYDSVPLATPDRIALSIEMSSSTDGTMNVASTTQWGVLRSSLPFGSGLDYSGDGEIGVTSKQEALGKLCGQHEPWDYAIYSFYYSATPKQLQLEADERAGEGQYVLVFDKQ